jgi:hypothetical protein
MEIITPDERLALLEELARKQRGNLRRAGWMAWGSVLLAALVLAGLMYGGTKKLADLRHERDDLQQQSDQLSKQIESEKAQLKDLQGEKQFLGKIVGNAPAAQIKAAVNQELKQNPNSAKLLPQIYLQIVNPNDRAYAKDMLGRLQDAGYVVLGIEYVRTTYKFNTTEVRYRKKADEPKAKEIVDALKKAGDKTANPVYLKKDEDNPRVLPNYFEIWFPDLGGQSHPFNVQAAPAT